MPICEGVYPPLSLVLPKKERGTRGERKALSLVAKWAFAHLAGREWLVRYATKSIGLCRVRRTDFLEGLCRRI